MNFVERQNHSEKVGDDVRSTGTIVFWKRFLFEQFVNLA